MTAPLQVGGSIVLLRRLSRQLVAYLGDQVYIDRRRKIRIQSHWSRLHDPAATDHSNVYYHPDPERFRRWSPAEQVLGYFALSDHETAHLRYTDRNAWLRFTARYSGSSMLQLLAHHLLNILEDARIERAHLEEWPATSHRLAWLNEQYYEAADPIRSDMDPATALVVALNQAKFGFYFHAGAFKGTLPPEVDAYWPEAKAHLDASRMAATTHEVVQHAEAILQKILDSRWLRDSSRLLRPQIGIGVSRPNRVPGTSRPRPAPPRRRDRHGGSGGQGRTDADRERRSESPPGQSPPPHSSTGSRQEHDADSATETQAGLGLGAEDADQSASGNGVPGNSNGGEQDPSETGEDGQSEASGAPDGAAGAEQEARARSGSRREDGDPDTESAADDTDSDGGDEGSGDPNGAGSAGNHADSDEPARGMSQADPKSDGGSADGSGRTEADTNAPAGREGQGSFGEDHRDDGGSVEETSRHGDTGDRRPEASSGSGRSGASTEASGEERGADPGAEAVLDGSCAGDGSGDDDPPEVTPSVEEAVREANALLRQIEREEHEVIDGAVASAQELLEAARTSLPPIRMDDVPPDLHAEIVPVVRHAGLHPEALEPYYLESEPAAGRLARQMQALLERRRQSLRGLRNGRPDPHRVRLEEVSDRIIMRRIQEGQLNVAVLISVDESASMFTANRVLPARRALCLLHGALRRLRIPHAIVGHSAARQHVFARVLVGFRESLRPTAWWSLANGPDLDLNERGGGEARDGYSLRLGAKWLARQPQRQKLLLFISDGQVNHTFRPAAAPGDPRYDYSLNGGVGVLDTRLAVREAEKSGIQVVGISIGEEHAYMESIYPRRICCRTVEELPAAFVKILSSLILTA